MLSQPYYHKACKLAHGNNTKNEMVAKINVKDFSLKEHVAKKVNGGCLYWIVLKYIQDQNVNGNLKCLIQGQNAMKRDL